ncbi:hypothetical protein B0H11DRAFT_2190346 [Mycena galericulata]|nr:hypothetical protein B0H11DRAFT_2190346 [Mycena galericulata]
MDKGISASQIGRKAGRLRRRSRRVRQSAPMCPDAGQRPPRKDESGDVHGFFSLPALEGVADVADAPQALYSAWGCVGVSGAGHRTVGVSAVPRVGTAPALDVNVPTAIVTRAPRVPARTCALLCGRGVHVRDAGASAGGVFRGGARGAGGGATNYTYNLCGLKVTSSACNTKFKGTIRGFAYLSGSADLARSTPHRRSIAPVREVRFREKKPGWKEGGIKGQDAQRK